MMCFYKCLETGSEACNAVHGAYWVEILIYNTGREHVYNKAIVCQLIYFSCTRSRINGDNAVITLCTGIFLVKNVFLAWSDKLTRSQICRFLGKDVYNPRDHQKSQSPKTWFVCIIHVLQKQLSPKGHILRPLPILKMIFFIFYGADNWWCFFFDLKGEISIFV